MPRKKPEGLIDGCFGISEYCSKCDYAKDWEDTNERLCKSCRIIEGYSPEMKMVNQIIESSKVAVATGPVADGKRSIYCPAEPEHFSSTFNALVRGVWSAGGDGDGALFCRHYEYTAVAEIFAEYEIDMLDGKKIKMKDMYKIHTYPNEKRILFTDESNENISIEQWSGENDAKPWTDIVIIK